MLALEPVELPQALLDLVEAAGRGVDALAVAAQLARQVVGLDGERLRPLGERVERRIDALHRRQGAGGGGGALERAGGLQRRVPFQRGQPAGHRAPQALQVAQPLALRLQLGLLGLARLGALDLLELPHQQVELAVARARTRLQLLQRALGRPRVGVGGRARGAALDLGRAAEAVEDVELGGGERELAVLVLAVERQQRAADVAQVGRRRAAPAEVGARAPLRADAAGEHDLVGVGRQALPQLLAQLVGQREDALDVRLGRARPHDARPWLAAQQQVERVGEHGLAGAGLPRQGVEPRAEAQFGALDQQQVLDAELVEHRLDGLPPARDGPGALRATCDD